MKVVLIYIFPHHIKHKFMCLLAIHNSLNCVIISLSMFLLGCLSFSYRFCKEFFSRFDICVFNFVDGSFCYQKFKFLLLNLSSSPSSSVSYVMLRKTFSTTIFFNSVLSFVYVYIYRMHIWVTFWYSLVFTYLIAYFYLTYLSCSVLGWTYMAAFVRQKLLTTSDISST